MKSITKIILFLILFCAITQIGSAFSVSVTKQPAESVKPGDSIEVIIKLGLPSDFPIDHSIQITSDLKDQVLVGQLYYEATIPQQILQVDKDRLGNWIIYGWLLSGKTTPQVTISLKGTVPQVTTTQNVTILRIVELEGSTELSGAYSITRIVINPQEIASQISSIRNDANILKQNISVAASQGVDTTNALAKYNEADTAISKADSLKLSNINQAMTYLTTARTAIKDSYQLLEKADAQHQIDNVEATLTKVDDFITYFKVNRSVSSTDPRLIAITNKYDLASQSISSANDMLKAGNYIGAKGKSIESGKYATEAYNLSINLKNELGEGGVLPSINPIFVIIGIIVVLVIIGGIVAYRHYFQWDELG